MLVEMAVKNPSTTEKIAPVQGYRSGIPWSMHLRAYDAYCKKWGKQEAMIDLEGRNCRGGFHVSELDEFIPGWREELSEISQLKTEIKQLRDAIEAEAVHFEKIYGQYMGMSGNLVAERLRAALRLR